MLRVGNIFTSVCLFTERGSDILPWDHNPVGPQKQVVCIPLECFLVFFQVFYDKIWKSKACIQCYFLDLGNTAQAIS